MKNLTFLSFAVFFLFPTFATTQRTIKDISTTFFEKFNKDSDAAFDYLFGTNEWMKTNVDGVSNVKFKVRESANLMGNYIGHELINEKAVGQSMKIEVYLAKFERQPLRFILTYYKPRDSWMIYNFSFDESLDDDLESYVKQSFTTNIK